MKVSKLLALKRTGVKTEASHSSLVADPPFNALMFE